MSRETHPAGFWFVWGAVVILAIAHQDLWFWAGRTLLFGFLPVGLAYHALFSIMAACVWALAVRFAWPTHIEEWADEFETEPARRAGDTGSPR